MTGPTPGQPETPWVASVPLWTWVSSVQHRGALRAEPTAFIPGGPERRHPIAALVGFPVPDQLGPGRHRRSSPASSRSAHPTYHTVRPDASPQTAWTSRVIDIPDFGCEFGRVAPADL